MLESYRRKIAAAAIVATTSITQPSQAQEWDVRTLGPLKDRKDFGNVIDRRLNSGDCSIIYYYMAANRITEGCLKDQGYSEYVPTQPEENIKRKPIILKDNPEVGRRIDRSLNFKECAIIFFLKRGERAFENCVREILPSRVRPYPETKHT